MLLKLFSLLAVTALPRRTTHIEPMGCRTIGTASYNSQEDWELYIRLESRAARIKNLEYEKTDRMILMIQN